ncbi:hypothetical protein DBV15_06388 [Temnothorax longispinosus]|uniref:Uncharacterized protein n=1 Tax=Temnothorax longispinosus TaxID=300112 RepID=A0A4S2KD60_9HYME|nr:hypothetical protein DBV15_06388 [Temnothorax longispinosus]
MEAMRQKELRDHVGKKRRIAVADRKSVKVFSTDNSKTRHQYLRALSCPRSRRSSLYSQSESRKCRNEGETTSTSRKDVTVAQGETPVASLDGREKSATKPLMELLAHYNNVSAGCSCAPLCEMKDIRFRGNVLTKLSRGLVRRLADVRRIDLGDGRGERKREKRGTGAARGLRAPRDRAFNYCMARTNLRANGHRCRTLENQFRGRHIQSTRAKGRMEWDTNYRLARNQKGQKYRVVRTRPSAPRPYIYRAYSESNDSLLFRAGALSNEDRRKLPTLHLPRPIPTGSFSLVLGSPCEPGYVRRASSSFSSRDPRKSRLLSDLLYFESDYRMKLVIKVDSLAENKARRSSGRCRARSDGGGGGGSRR